MPNEDAQGIEARDAHLVRQVHITLERYRLGRYAVIALGVVGSLYVGIALPIKYTAGQETVLNIFYRAVLDLKLGIIIPYVLILIFFILWQRERKVRKSSVKREHQRVVELEKTKDPSRTSSGFEE